MDLAARAIFLPQNNRTSFLAMRNIALPVALVGASAFLHGEFMFTLAIIVGQAHFLMAYLYQWRAKKMTQSYFLFAAIIAVLLLAYFVLSGDPLVLFLGLSIFFALHFVVDELTLHDEKWNTAKLINAGGFMVLFSVLIVHVIFPMPTIVFSAIGLVVLIVAGRLAQGFESVSTSEYYLWFLQLLMVLLVVVIAPVSQIALTVFILLAHFFNWMIGYSVKTTGTPMYTRYWTETVFFLMLCTVGYGLFWFAVIPGLSIFFGVAAYHAWAAAHIALSFFLYRPQWG